MCPLYLGISLNFRDVSHPPNFSRVPSLCVLYILDFLGFHTKVYVLFLSRDIPEISQDFLGCAPSSTLQLSPRLMCPFYPGISQSFLGCQPFSTLQLMHSFYPGIYRAYVSFPPHYSRIPGLCVLSAYVSFPPHYSRIPGLCVLSILGVSHSAHY